MDVCDISPGSLVQSDVPEPYLSRDLPSVRRPTLSPFAMSVPESRRTMQRSMQLESIYAPKM